MLENYLLTIWHSANSLLMAHCTSYAKNHFCRQEENQGTRFIALLIHLLTLPTKTVLLLVPDLVRFFQTTYFLCATESNWSDRLQMSTSSEQISQVQSTFPSLKTRSTFLDPCRYWTCWQLCPRMQIQMWQKDTSALQNHDHAPATAWAQGLEEGLNCNGLTAPATA